MAIRNYTTTISPLKTVMEIQTILAKAGAKNVSIDYESGVPVNVLFLVEFNGQFLSFRLPANHLGVYEALRKEQVPVKYKTEDHARRVAWRITKDWIDVQLALIEAKKATLAEVFLPYWVGPDGQTLYNSFVQKGFPALPGGDPSGISEGARQ